MAAIPCRGILPLLRINNSWNFRCGKESCSRLYSVFAPEFKNPILDNNKINETLKTTSEEEILVTRIKPALNCQTISPFYHPDVEKFTNIIMKKGKKKVAQQLVSDTFLRIKHIQLRKYNNESDEKKKKEILLNPLDVFELALKNVTPLMWYLRVKKSGSWYKVPVGISELSARKRALKWLVTAGNEKNSNTPFELEMAEEIVAAANYKGKAISKKLELYKMCESNRGYVHYWWV